MGGISWGGASGEVANPTQWCLPVVVRRGPGDGCCHGNKSWVSPRCSQPQPGRGRQQEFPQRPWPRQAQDGRHTQLGQLTFCQSHCGILTKRSINIHNSSQNQLPRVLNSSYCCSCLSVTKSVTSGNILGTKRGIKDPLVNKDEQ